jgi:hypothetical protein
VARLTRTIPIPPDTLALLSRGVKILETETTMKTAARQNKANVGCCAVEYLAATVADLSPSIPTRVATPYASTRNRARNLSSQIDFHRRQSIDVARKHSAITNQVKSAKQFPKKEILSKQPQSYSR